MKKTLFLDLDSTISDTNYAFCQYYNDHYRYVKGFKPADSNKLTEWNFTDICPLAVDDVQNIFGKKELFDRLEFFPNAYETLKELSDKYNIVIVSIGTYANIHYKSMWIKENLPFIHESILLCKDKGAKMGKSTVNMQGGIFIDDIKANLDSTNADRKILYGKKYRWNQDWEGEHCLDWLRVGERLL